MVRRRTIEEPTSRLAIWARRVALFSLAATLIAVIIVRSGALEIVPALSTLAGALVLAVLAILLAFGAALSIWFEGVGGAREAATAFFIGCALIAYPAFLGIKGYRLPAIYDITTDPIDPPRFDAIARLRPRDANPITYQGLYTAELQHAAYSDIEPDVTDSTPREAYDAAMKVITKRKWRIVDARPPRYSRRAHADPRFPRRPGGADPADRRRRPHRRALGLSLRPPRPRHQRIAGAQPPRRYRRCVGGTAQAYAVSAAGPGQQKSAGQACISQTIGAGERRRSLGRDHAARDEILHMRKGR